MADYWYPNGLLSLIEDNNAAAPDVRFVLLDGAAAFGATDTHVSDLTLGTYECDFTNYTTFAGGGQDLAGVTFEVDTAHSPDRIKFDATDYTISSAGGATNNTIVALVTYIHTGTDSTSDLLTWHDVSVTTNGGDLTISFHADGIGEITVTGVGA